MVFFIHQRMMNIFKIFLKGDRVPYKVVDYNEYLTSPKAKLIIICKPEYMDQIIERSKTFHSDDYKSSSLKQRVYYTEYMDPRISKTVGLKEILNYIILILKILLHLEMQITTMI